jgi:hypothetical protein
MGLDTVTVAVGSLGIATVSLGVSAVNAWLTLWRRGAVRMAQPPTVYFGPDGARELHPKIFVRCFLYSTSARSQCVESMFARVRRGDSAQTFPVWVCGGARDDLSRGAGLAVGAQGIALHHHFLLPRDGTTYRFLPGSYVVELFAIVVGLKGQVKLRKIEVQVSEAQAEQLRGNTRCGLYFDWSPETCRFQGHIDTARPPDPAPLLFLAADPKSRSEDNSAGEKIRSSPEAP